ncbi:MAG: YeeE/YedE family protein [Myxococcales bacterium]|nr:YeeE/YedE family protein [Myxococcales bacterium]
MFSYILDAIIGGAIIGLAASWLLLAKGRVAGISGIVGSLLTPWSDDSVWRLSFVGGLLVGGALLVLILPTAIVAPSGRSLALLAAAGLAVGYGTQLGSGCTSGHGICGLSRFSPRSLVATLTFMATGFATATVIGLMGVGS